MNEPSGWLSLGFTSSQMTWLIVSQLLFTFIIPIIGSLLYYRRVSRAVEAGRFDLVTPPDELRQLRELRETRETLELWSLARSRRPSRQRARRKAA